jgi:hypothetical protein
LLVALVASWVGLVVTPQLQIGGAQPGTNVVDTTQRYPLPRSGEARRGLDVYRSLGCAACHSQHIRQTGALLDVILADSGTNHAEVVLALVSLIPGSTVPGADKLVQSAPTNILMGVEQSVAAAAVERLSVGGAKVDTRIVGVGPDLAREWGEARSVAADFLYDYPVLLGSQRLGPDLSNIGRRRPDANWLFGKLYAPRQSETNSVMPPYRFLFQKRRIEFHPSPDALDLPPELVGERGVEVIPTPEAKALVAYLLSLRSDTPLFERPMTAVAQTQPTTVGEFPQGSRTNLINP